MGANGSKAIGEFPATYLGSVPVKHATGNDICADAVVRVKSMAQSERKVKIVVSGDGIQVVDSSTHKVIQESPVTDLSFVSLDAQDKKLLTYITNNERAKLIMCHAFRVKAKAHEIPIAISEAFRIAADGSDEGPSETAATSAAGVAVAAQAAGDAPKAVAAPAAGAERQALGVYQANYLGSVPVKEPKGNAIVLEAVKRIKAMGQNPKGVEIIVTGTAIEVVDFATKDVIKSVPIMEVSFTALDPRDSKLFSYVTNDARLGLMYCHAFAVKHKAEQIPSTISRAFRIAVEKLGGMPRLRSNSDVHITGSKSSVFEAKYIGSVPVQELAGNEVVLNAVERAKKLPSQGEGVVLAITSEGIRTIEGLTQEVVQSVFIKNVSFTTAVDKNTIFAFITNDDRLGRRSCHVFQCRHRAMELCLAVGEAFKAAAAEAKARSGNPFMPLSADREAVSGPLFTRQIHRRDLRPASKPIGAGQFGEVYRAAMRKKDAPEVSVAVKLLRGAATEKDKAEFIKEAETMLAFDHENLVTLIGVSIQQRPWLCVIPYMNYGDMRDVLQTCWEKGYQLHYIEQLHCARQICSGMEYLANLRYIHMDLAARNCLLHDNCLVKVADFGLTRKLDPGSDVHRLVKTAKLPIKWMSIEGLDKKIFSEKSDVWAFGVLLWEIQSYGGTPYTGCKNQEIQRLVREGMRLTRPDDAEPGLFQLATTCWHQDRHKRKTFTELGQALASLAAGAEQHPVRDIGKALSRM